MISKRKDFTLGLCISVLLYLCFVSTNLSSEEIKILVYNTHGLPSAFVSDDPERRFPLISEKTKGYELSLLQEDFAHHELLLKSLNEESVAVRGNGNNKSLCPFCSGSGLTIISNLEKEWQIQIDSQAFSVCSGWFGGLNDCFSSKGFQLARIKTPSGKYFFVLNTHLDVGRKLSDRKAREIQLKEIIDKVKLKTKGEALIVAGDLNLRWDDPKDQTLLEAFKRELDLEDPIKGAQKHRGWPILDYILYRESKNTAIQILESGEDIAFEFENKPLSDHPALFVEILVN